MKHFFTRAMKYFFLLNTRTLSRVCLIICGLLLALLSAKAQPGAGITYFTFPDFGAIGPLGPLKSTTDTRLVGSGANQFTFMHASADSYFEINNKQIKNDPYTGYYLAFSRPENKTFLNLNGKAGFVRSTNFDPEPKWLRLKFSMAAVVTEFSGADSKEAAGIIYIGNNFINEESAPSDDKVFARLVVTVKGDNNYKVGGSLSPNTRFNGWIDIDLVMNNTNSAWTYDAPDGTKRSLPAQKYNIWASASGQNVWNIISPSGGGGPDYGRISSGPVSLRNIAFNISFGDAEVRFKGGASGRVLPVDLISFKAQPAGGKVELAWETAWERNSKEFVVQRSSDLKEFSDLGHIPGSGNANGRNSYTFTDHNPAPGTNYYRLRMVDEDNTYEYSKVVDAIVRPDLPMVLVSPNPASGQLIRLRAFGVAATSLRLTNLLGQDIPFRTNSPGGDIMELLPQQFLPTGLYLLSFNQDGYQQHTHVLVR